MSLCSVFVYVMVLVVLCIFGLVMILSSGVFVWFRLIFVILVKFLCSDLFVFFLRCVWVRLIVFLYVVLLVFLLVGIWIVIWLFCMIGILYWLI